MIIWFKGSTSYTQNWRSFLLSYKNRYRFIIYMIINIIFIIKINEYWIQYIRLYYNFLAKAWQ